MVKYGMLKRRYIFSNKNKKSFSKKVLYLNKNIKKMR